jgi:beta propeller repeat protein
MPVLFPNCVVNTTDPIGTNCSQVASGNSTTPEISINNLNLTHNHKYYFEVRAWNKALLNSTTRYSDGIIYLDNAPPGDLIILWINDANHSGSPYPTTIETNIINITAIGDLDGYNDIDNCVLLNDNIDYTESGPFAVNCSEYPHSYYYNATYPNVTWINCTRNTTTSLPAQGTWSWYLSCRDHYWNTNTFTQNQLVWFTVDWPEPPVITIDLLPVQAYSGDDMTCNALISDPEDDLNFTNITFTWYRNDALIATHYSSASDPDSDGIYTATDYLSYAYTSRGNSINCTVSAGDEQGEIGINSSAVTIRNTQPYSLSMLLPNAETVHNNMSFSWWGPFDDVDSDFMTLEIQVDDEENFNASNNPTLSFNPALPMTVGGLAIPGTQRNADVYGTKIVYEDNRAGGSWDIYMYDTETDEENSIATSSNPEINPKIYGDFVIYERDLGTGMSELYLHNLSSSVTTLIVSSINTSSADLFGNYITYNDGSKVRFRDIRSINVEHSANGSSSNASKTVVYGKNIVWLTSDGNACLYDLVNASPTCFSTTDRRILLFGSLFVKEDPLGLIYVINLMNNSLLGTFTGSNASIYGGLLAYTNSSGNIAVSNLLSQNLYNISLGLGDNPVIYDKLVVFESGTDLYYATRRPVLPATFIVESPTSSSYVYTVNTLLSPDATYVWRIKGCDNAFANNSCVWGLNSTSLPDPLAKNFTYFTIDNTEPVISSVSPADGSVVAGQFRVYANIVDNLGADAVTYANYSITYRNNGTVRSSGSLSRSGTVWSSPLLNFLDINVSEFNLIIRARDTMYNLASAQVNLTVNNNTPWFLFGTGIDEMTEDGQKVFNTVIDSDFIAFTVLTSTIRMVGPLPATTQRFIQSKTNLTVTNHNYSDPISTLTWPDGNYRVEFTGTNLDGSNHANRTFYVDRNYPTWSGNQTIPSVAYAASTLTLSINWSDTTLRQVNITHNNSNISNPAQVTIPSNTTSSGVFNVTAIDVSAYINRTFYWYSTAVDGLGRVNTTTPIFEAFINDNPPSFAGSIPTITVNEDNFTTSGLPNLSAYFSDPNVGGSNSLDNLTFTATYDPTNLSVIVNATTGLVLNVSASNNFNGNRTVIFNATDKYGKMNYSNNVTIVVNSVNDAPVIAAIPDVLTEEDNSSGINYTLSASDVDLDTVTWLMPENVNASVFNLTSYNLATGRFNFTLMPNQFGVYNITFRATDGTLIAKRNATINITNVNDIPLIGNFTTPGIGTNNSGSVWLSWSTASDQPNEGQTMSYNLDYSTDGGLSWTNIAPYATLLDSLAYSWDTSLMTTRVNVTLRLNVTDGLAMNYTEYGNFSVDNQKPTITINSPTTIMVGPWFITNIVTSEPASCIFTVNGTVSIVPPTTTLTTLHAVNISGYTYDLEYNLTVSCTDSTGNSNSTSRLFEPRSSALSFIRAYASPSWLYQNQLVNITLEIASNSTWSAVLIDVVPPSGSAQTLTLANFTPTIDASNKVTSLDSITVISTSAIGKYNLSINSLWNIDGIGVAPPPILIQDLFEVFESVNQTLNIE